MTTGVVVTGRDGVAELCYSITDCTPSILTGYSNSLAELAYD